VLTLAVAVGVGGLLLVSTIRAGQVRASWDLVGADASVTADDVGPVAARLRDAPGVTGVATARVVTGARADLGNRDAEATVLAVDASYVGLAADLPGASGVAALDELPYGTTVPVPERGGPRPIVPAVVSPQLADRIGTRGLSIWVAGSRTEIEVLGTTEHAPRGLGPGPYVFLALGTLIADDGPLAPTVAWASGPGAAEAAASAVEALAPGSATVAAQAAWLAESRADALVQGVERTLVGGAGVAGLLAAVGAIATALAGARERGRTLALLRTLGMRPRLGWWLAGVELAPVVLAALVAGSAAGAVVVGVLGESLGLDVLVGGVGTPSVAVDAGALAGVAVGALALLLVAVAVDALAHRRMRLAEVLRVGETPGG
jgi:putative ABC transport system permease protein